ncbi:MAG TPA: hypothetical protein VEU30_08085, partial [Thermoanaerobaculia bacterium]|nr:hypothetical protein [Thermoanaerobaculia bacterium]
MAEVDDIEQHRDRGDRGIPAVPPLDDRQHVVAERCLLDHARGHRDGRSPRSSDAWYAADGGQAILP